MEEQLLRKDRVRVSLDEMNRSQVQPKYFSRVVDPRISFLVQFNAQPKKAKVSLIVKSCVDVQLVRAGVQLT
jgi:hypothetical protein